MDGAYLIRDTAKATVRTSPNQSSLLSGPRKSRLNNDSAGSSREPGQLRTTQSRSHQSGLGVRCRSLSIQCQGVNEALLQRGFPEDLEDAAILGADAEIEIHPFGKDQYAHPAGAVCAHDRARRCQARRTTASYFAPARLSIRR